MRLKVPLHLDDLVKHAGVMFFGMGIVHAATLLFQILAGRILSPEHYSLLAAFIGLSVIVQRPLSSLTTRFAHQSRILEQRGCEARLTRVLRGWALNVGGPVAAVSLLLVAASGPLSRRLGLADSLQIFYLGLMLPSLFANAVLEGVVQGLQQFNAWSASHIGGAVSRLLLLVLLLFALSRGASPAVLAYAAGGYVSTLILARAIRKRLQGRPPAESAPSVRMHQHLAANTVMLMAYAVLMTLDVVLVNRSFPDHPTFALSATLSRMVVFLPMAIGMALFPKVVSEGRGNPEQHGLFLRACTWTAAMIFLAVGICWLFPGLLMFILFGLGELDIESRWQIRAMCAAMGLSALLNLILQYLLAQCRFRELTLLPVCAALYIGLGVFLPLSVSGLVLLALTCNAAACLSLLPALWLRPRPITTQHA